MRKWYRTPLFTFFSLNTLLFAGTYIIARSGSLDDHLYWGSQVGPAAIFFLFAAGLLMSVVLYEPYFRIRTWEVRLCLYSAVFLLTVFLVDHLLLFLNGHFDHTLLFLPISCGESWVESIYLPLVLIYMPMCFIFNWYYLGRQLRGISTSGWRCFDRLN